MSPSPGDDGDGVDRSDLTLMAGPGVRFGKRGGTVFFLRALAGLVRDLGFDRGARRGHQRVVEPLRRARGRRHRLPHRDYLWNNVEEGSKASGFRASAGILYRFGIAP